MTGTRRLLAAASTFLLLTGCVTPDQSGSAITTTQATATSGDDPGIIVTESSEGFDEFVEESFAVIIARQPELVTELGLDAELGTRPARLDDLSPGFLDETDGLVADTLSRLHSYDLEQLTGEQKVTYLAYEWHLEQMSEMSTHRLLEWPVHFMLNSYNQGVISLLTEVHPLRGESDIEDLLSRVEAVPAQVAEVVEWMEGSESAGALPAAYVIEATIDQIRGDIAGGDPAATAIFRSFVDRLERLNLADDVEKAYAADAETAVAAHFIPAWRELIAHLESVVEPAGDDISLSRLPGGETYYQSLLRYHTSTDMTPDEIHDLGWAEAVRIKAEMLALGAAAGLEAREVGSIRAHFSTSAGFIEGPAIVTSYEEIIAEANRAFQPYFGVTPAASLEIVADPGPTAYYIGPAVDGSRPGSFHAGTGGQGVAVYTMRSLAFHEAVPGHHFQIALGQELDLPSPQRFLTNTGHVEGWALYAERLAADIGMYADDPAGDFGRLDLELLRAARLVVDTGIHHLGWSRSEAIEAMSEIVEGERFNHEIDRYVLYPGQATAYMIGMLSILDMRSSSGATIAEAEALARFHDQVIGRGNLPLPVIARIPELIGA